MVEFVKWFVLIVLFIRLLVTGYVGSKHGEEKEPQEFNVFSHIFVTGLWVIMAYTLWFLI